MKNPYGSPHLVQLTILLVLLMRCTDEQYWPHDNKIFSNHSLNLKSVLEVTIPNVVVDELDVDGIFSIAHSFAVVCLDSCFE